MFKLIKPIDEVSEIRDINTQQIKGYKIFIKPEDVNKSIVDIKIPEKYQGKVEIIKDSSGIISEILVYEVVNLKDFLKNLKQDMEVELVDNQPIKEESFEI